MNSPSVISRKEFIKRMKACGFDGPFAGGKHQYMAKGSLKVRIPNPHGNNEIHIGLVKEILRQADITQEDWDQTKGQ